VDQKTLFEKALELPEDARVRLVEDLLASLPPDVEAGEDDEFLAELRRRSDEIDQGKAELIPWEQLRRELE
jgi:putative addiction module component (TIGR02574 family)